MQIVFLLKKNIKKYIIFLKNLNEYYLQWGETYI